MPQSSNGVRAHRLTVALVVGLVSVAVFATAGLAGKPAKGQDDVAAAQDVQVQDAKKVELCHKGKRTLRVGLPALPAHLRHGDAVGPCSEGLSARSQKSGKKTAQTEETDDSAAVNSHGKANGKSRGKGKSTSDNG